MNLLVIDLDGTLTKTDNLVGFSIYMIVRKMRLRFLLLFPLVALLKAGIIGNVKLKKLYSLWIIRNFKVDYLANCANTFVQGAFPRSVDRAVIERIESFGESFKVMLSANFPFIVEPASKYLGYQKWIAIELESSGGRYTGRILGSIPYGQEKIGALDGAVVRTSYSKTIGIGDSKSDIPLLKSLDLGFLVKRARGQAKTLFSEVSEG